MPSFGQLPLPSPRQTLKGKIEVARILNISSADFARLIDEVEHSPLFLKLFSGAAGFKIFRRKPFSRARLAPEFYELPETVPAAAGGDIESHLEQRRELVELIRRMGRENFERYFLHNDGDLPAEEIAARCGIRAEEVSPILQLVDRALLESEMSPPLRPPSAPQIHYTNLARIVREGEELSIAFFSPRLAQGLYQVDHQKLAELRKKELLQPEERRALNALLSKVSLINLRKNSLYQLLLKLCEFQKRFLLDEKEENLVPLSQKRMAEELALSASSVCRLIYGRSLQTPEGREAPLEAFFPSRKDWLKDRVRAILRESDPLTDTQLQHVIEKRYGIPLSRRSVNQYRCEINRKGRRRA